MPIAKKSMPACISQVRWAGQCAAKSDSGLRAYDAYAAELDLTVGAQERLELSGNGIIILQEFVPSLTVSGGSEYEMRQGSLFILPEASAALGERKKTGTAVQAAPLFLLRPSERIGKTKLTESVRNEEREDLSGKFGTSRKRLFCEKFSDFVIFFKKGIDKIFLLC